MLTNVHLGAKITCLRLNGSAGGLSTCPRHRCDGKLFHCLGCPKLVDLIWYLDGLTPLTDGNGQNVDDLTELLESRAKQSSEKTYFEIDVFGEFGPWKADSYHYSNT